MEKDTNVHIFRPDQKLYGLVDRKPIFYWGRKD